MERITKTQLANQLAVRHQLTRQHAQLLVNDTLEMIAGHLKRQGTVYLHGLGTFTVVPTPERSGMQPQTGERITIPAKHRVRFKAARELQVELHGNEDLKNVP